MNRASLANHNENISPGFFFIANSDEFFENITFVIFKAKFVIF